MPVILKCKMCGGDLATDASDVAVCLYCGSKQILPKLNDERKTNLYDRANHYRSINEFDKAFSLYEQILVSDNTDAEIYWDLVLCRYGIEYVKDPATGKRIPTVNRTQYQSIFDDVNYLYALKYASEVQKDVIKEEAAKINDLQQNILSISSHEEPYDIFICYKESDANDNRTIDSVIAQEIYEALDKEEYKVFFSRITLEDKLGKAYEPYIFSALNTAQVMLVIGTSPENFKAVWVKNEWSRFLGLINAGSNKTLIPVYKDMDPYDLPEEFAHLQAQDIGKVGSLQDIIRGINKIIGTNGTTVRITSALADVNEMLKRGSILLESGDFDAADKCYERILDINSENVDAYLGKLMVNLKVRSEEDFKKIDVDFSNDINYKMICRFATDEFKKKINSYLHEALIRTKYKLACNKSRSQSLNDLKEAIQLFEELDDWEDSKQQAQKIKLKYKDVEQKIALEEEEHLLQMARNSRNAKFLGLILICGILIIALLCGSSFSNYYVNLNWHLMFRRFHRTSLIYSLLVCISGMLHIMGIIRIKSDDSDNRIIRIVFFVGFITLSLAQIVLKIKAFSISYYKEIILVDAAIMAMVLIMTHKKIVSTLTIALLSVTIITLAILYPQKQLLLCDSSEILNDDCLYIVDSYTNLREEPSKESSKIYELYQGMIFPIEKTVEVDGDEWYKITTIEGIEGYVKSDVVGIKEDYIIKIKSLVNVRSSYFNEDENILGQVYHDDRFTCYGIRGDYYIIKYKGTFGYVNQQYAEKVYR